MLIMSEADIEKVRRMEQCMFELPDQGTLPTDHLFHAGMYARTLKVPKGITVAGAYMIIPTLLVISGHCAFFAGEKAKELKGHTVLAGFSHRKQVLHAIEDTTVTMVFKTEAKTVEEAENEFTNEAHILWSRRPDAINNVSISGV